LRPGNAGIAQHGTCVPLKASDQAGLLQFAREQQIDLTVVGPDDVLAAGLVDLFEAHGLRIFGPTKAAAQLESSKGLREGIHGASWHPDGAIRELHRQRRGAPFLPHSGSSGGDQGGWTRARQRSDHRAEFLVSGDGDP
jgi:phosphoribosylamine--glycine ligase